MQSPWIDRLFGRLQVRYGSQWTMAWEGINIAAIKADWVDALGLIFERNPKAIAYALENLPDRPPTSDQFRRICNLAPPPEVPRLAEPAADKERVAAALAVMQKPKPSDKSPADVCAEGLRKKLNDGIRLTPAQRDMLAACERARVPESVVMAAFTPIPAELLPPAMRADIAGATT